MLRIYEDAAQNYTVLSSIWRITANAYEKKVTLDKIEAFNNSLT